MSTAGARSATRKAGKIVLSAAAVTAAVGLGTAAVIFGPAAAVSREPAPNASDMLAAQFNPRQGPQLVQIAVAKPAGAPERAFTGIISAGVQSNLGFRVPGKVIERLVDVGQEVRAGQPLMRLDPKDLDLALTAKENAVAAARARAAQARADEARYRQRSATPNPAGRCSTEGSKLALGNGTRPVKALNSPGLELSLPHSAAYQQLLTSARKGRRPSFPRSGRPDY